MAVELHGQLTSIINVAGSHPPGPEVMIMMVAEEGFELWTIALSLSPSAKFLHLLTPTPFYTFSAQHIDLIDGLGVLVPQPTLFPRRNLGYIPMGRTLRERATC
jgi:hypothetical protein